MRSCYCAVAAIHDGRKQLVFSGGKPCLTEASQRIDIWEGQGFGDPPRNAAVILGV